MTSHLKKQPGSALNSQRSAMMNGLCRLCACTNEELVPVFEEKGLEQKLLEKIHAHLPIKVTREDLLPVSLCVNCIFQLDMCHEFLQCCLKADEKLTTLLREDTNKSEINNDLQCEVDNNVHCGELDDDFHSDTYVDLTDDSENVVIKQEEHRSNVGINSSRDENLQLVNDQTKDQDINKMQLVPSWRSILKPKSYDKKGKIEYSFVHMKSAQKQKQKYKVFVLKWKNISNMSKEAQVKRALKLLKNSKNSQSHIGNVEPNFDERETLDHNVHEVDSAGIEIPNNSSKSLLSHSSSSSDLPVLSAEDSRDVQVTSTLCDETTSVENGEAIEDTHEKTVDHSYTNWNQKPYYCMYCNKIVVGRINLMSHQKTSHPDKVFCCPVCDIVIHKSRTTVEQHEKTHFEPVTDETDSLASKIISGLKDNEFIDTNISTSTDDQNNHTNSEESACVAASQNSALSSSKINGLSELEFIPVADVHIDAHKSIVNEFPNFELKVTNDFKTIEKRHQSKIINSIADFIGKSKCNEVNEKPKHNTVTDLENARNSKITDLTEKSNASEVTVLINKAGDIEVIDLTEESKCNKVVTAVERTFYPKPCSQCDHVSFTKEVYKEHLRIHPWKKKRKFPAKQCTQCNYVSLSKEAFLEHIKLHPVTYSCQVCNKQFSSNRSLKNHSYKHATEKPFICEYCGKGFCFNHLLKRHKCHHGKDKNMFECEDCGKKCITKRGFDTHRESHGTASYLCDLCGKSLKRSSSLRKHLVLHHDPNFYRKHSCSICGKSYNSRYHVNCHMRTHTNERPYKCPHCSKCFRIKELLSLHMSIHTNARKHKCPVCGKGFNRRSNMTAHTKIHNPTFTCSICKESFKDGVELYKHRETHSIEELSRSESESVHMCDVCGKLLRSSLSLKYHTLSHGVKSFSCDVCGKLLASRLTLKYHVLSHGVKSFSCDVCGKGFASKMHLCTHQKSHVRKYFCQFCNKEFQNKEYLIVHERKHTGETPFQCEHCDKRFISAMYLKSHSVIHRDIRPFHCSHCDKKFKRSDTLNAHVRIHTGERPFSCKVCNRSFTQKGDCNKHQRKHFKGQMVPELISSCVPCGLNFSEKEELEDHIKEFHSGDVTMVPSGVMSTHNENPFVASL